MLLHYTVGQDPDETDRLLNKLVEDNQVSRGLLLPEGDSDAGSLCLSLLGFVPSWLEAMGGTGARIRGLMRDDFLEPHRRTDIIATLLGSLDVRRRLEGRNAVHSALYLWAKTILPHYILSNLGDRMEMAHSVEGRVPFMDHRVAEYLHQVPVSMKIRGMTEKYILREAAKDILTDTVYQRQKHPFLSPPATLHPEEPLHALMQDTLRSKATADVPFLDHGKVVAALDAVRNPDADAGYRTVMDQVLTLALSFVFMHEGLGMSG
jgi:asparagine synthase (glutamine-hydrolysing)